MSSLLKLQEAVPCVFVKNTNERFQYNFNYMSSVSMNKHQSGEAMDLSSHLLPSSNLLSWGIMGVHILLVLQQA